VEETGVNFLEEDNEFDVIVHSDTMKSFLQEYIEGLEKENSERGR
jgi:hypothetical protein